MELKHRTSRFRIPTSSRAVLSDSAAQYQLIPSPTNHLSKIGQGRRDSVVTKMMKLRESMKVFAQEIKEQVRLETKLSELVKRKLSLGTRIFQAGGVEKVFEQKFNMGDNEKLMKASQCYLSTTAGLIAGLLFISTDKVTFCSEKSIEVSSPTGKGIKVHYKVMIPLRKIKKVQECVNAKK